MQERRAHLRFDKAFPVHLQHEGGTSRAIARNISARGIFVELSEPLPLGARLQVTFSGEDGTEMTCLCEVRYQVALSFGRPEHEGTDKPDIGFSRGLGLRIVAYETQEDHPWLLVDRERVLH